MTISSATKFAILSELPWSWAVGKTRHSQLGISLTRLVQTPVYVKSGEDKKRSVWEIRRMSTLWNPPTWPHLFKTCFKTGSARVSTFPVWMSVTCACYSRGLSHFLSVTLVWHLCVTLLGLSRLSSGNHALLFISHSIGPWQPLAVLIGWRSSRDRNTALWLAGDHDVTGIQPSDWSTGSECQVGPRGALITRKWGRSVLIWWMAAT